MISFVLFSIGHCEIQISSKPVQALVLGCSSIAVVVSVVASLLWQTVISFGLSAHHSDVEHHKLPHLLILSHVLRSSMSRVFLWVMSHDHAWVMSSYEHHKLPHLLILSTLPKDRKCSEFFCAQKKWFLWKNTRIWHKRGVFLVFWLSVANICSSLVSGLEERLNLISDWLSLFMFVQCLCCFWGGNQELKHYFYLL